MKKITAEGDHILVEKIDYEEKNKDKINLIYHTTPWRGLVNLVRIFKSLNLENVELYVCSSTQIYGKKFSNIVEKNYEKIFEECKNTKNINYMGFVENKEIIELLKKMHIYSVFF